MSTCDERLRACTLGRSRSRLWPATMLAEIDDYVCGRLCYSRLSRAKAHEHPHARAQGRGCELHMLRRGTRACPPHVHISLRNTPRGFICGGLLAPPHLLTNPTHVAWPMWGNNPSLAHIGQPQAGGSLAGWARQGAWCTRTDFFSQAPTFFFSQASHPPLCLGCPRIRSAALGLRWLWQQSKRAHRPSSLSWDLRAGTCTCRPGPGGGDGVVVKFRRPRP